MSKCKQCGLDLQSGIRYCPNCATKVDTPPEPAHGSDAFTGTISGTATIVAPERIDSPADLETGKEFHGRYTIECKLGQGAMGVVYLGNDKLTGRRVALKLIHPLLMNKPSARDRFIREGLIARDIRHKNVVAVYDVNETEGQYYLVMEYLSGETLRNWLHKTIQAGVDIPYDTAEKIIRNVLEGLGAAHAAGVVHRDVKPENIMLTGNPGAGDYSLKILDFGIARAAADSAANPVVTTTTSTGTALYMAPEQKTAADTVGPPADLYAVSVIFYELLLGVAPAGRWAPLSKERTDLSPAIDAVIDKGLNSRPKSRYQTAQEYLNSIGAIQAPPASSVQARGPAAGSTPPARAAQSLHSRTVEPAAAPQILAAKGRLRSESLVSSNVPPETLYQFAGEVLGSFCVKGMRSGNQALALRGQTGLSWKSPGQKISADIEAAPGGSTVNIAGQTMGAGLTDMGRGKEDIRRMTATLVQKLEAAGWKARVVREIHHAPPRWVVVLVLLGGLILLGAIAPAVVEWIDITLSSY